MNHTYAIEILKLSTIHELEDAWSFINYRALLDLCDFEGVNDIADAELLDYLGMALQENDPEDAAAIVIQYRLGDRLNKGQIQSVSHDMPEENLWEEYGDMSLHEELFNCTSLLYKAFNGRFPHPDAADLVLKISAAKADAAHSLAAFDESLLARILAFGQDDHAIINRLFDEKVIGDEFQEAKDIIWKYSVTERTETSVTVHITTGLYWVKGLRRGQAYEAKTHNDHA